MNTKPIDPKIRLKNNLNILKNRKKSFDYRICDDLCEVLLSYLSFEDKIRFECVSKQFQRCVFVKQFVIDLNDNKFLLNENQINEKAIEIVLKKCQNITALLLTSSQFFTQNTLKLITKYCLHLKEIIFDINGINEETIRQFGEICGQKLEKIYFADREKDTKDNKYKTLIKLCPNLRQLFRVKINDFIEIFLPQLKEVLILDPFVGFGYKESIELLVNKYKNQMNCLYLRTAFEDIDIPEVQSFEAIARFETLEELTLIEDMFPVFSDYMESIANNNKNLHKIYYRIRNSNTLYANRVFNKLKNLQNLKHLVLYMCANIYGDEQITTKSLSDCKQLQKLSLMHSNISDNFFENIHIYCPQLKSLEICLKSGTVEITDEAMKSLAKLKHLKHLNLLRFPHKYLGFHLITDTGLLYLIEKSPQINSITFNSQTNITNITINALKQLALSKPKITFRYRFGCIFDEDLFQRYYNFKTQEMPQNMNILCSQLRFLDPLFHISIITQNYFITYDNYSNSDSYSDISGSSQENSEDWN
jgi:hypothetical protein